MNLALKDIRHGLFRFILTCFGLGLLMTVVFAMMGIYNGLVVEALAVARAPAADLWVVEAGTKGPFAEASSIPADTRDAVARLPGVAEAGAVNYQNVETGHAGRSLRLYVIGHERGRPGGHAALPKAARWMPAISSSSPTSRRGSPWVTACSWGATASPSPASSRVRSIQAETRRSTSRWPMR